MRVGKGWRGGGCRARFTGIIIENSRFTGIKTDFSRITHNSAFDFHGSREINSFFHDSRQLKNRRSRFKEKPPFRPSNMCTKWSKRGEGEEITDQKLVRGDEKIVLTNIDAHIQSKKSNFGLPDYLVEKKYVRSY